MHHIIPVSFYYLRSAVFRTNLLPFWNDRFFYRDLPVPSTEDRIVTLLWYRCYTVQYGNKIFVGKCAVSNNTFPCHAVSVNRHFSVCRFLRTALKLLDSWLTVSLRISGKICFIYFLYYFLRTFTRLRLLYVGNILPEMCVWGIFYSEPVLHYTSRKHWCGYGSSAPLLWLLISNFQWAVEVS